ncbi:MAG TPA: VWA domain-containing protein [Gammaproteobacteria bacterium]|nr:VWA domain-containing protein [Gammaproteobacteria bacterium]
MRMKRRRTIETLNMSFLDTICNAFGALILLLIFTKIAQPNSLEVDEKQLDGKLARYEQELNDILGETEDVQRERNTAVADVSQEQTDVERLEQQLARVSAAMKSDKDDAEVTSELAGRLAQAKEKLSDEMKQLLANYKPRPDEYKIGGIPVDSEYIIFVIDTSGSMRQFEWDSAMRELSETLDVYPHVKGIQIMNDQGEYMFKSYRNQWIPDSPAIRKSVLAAMKNWNAFSNSSPRAGILAAIHTFYDPNKKISIYFFGDDFSQGSSAIDSTVREIDHENHASDRNGRRVRIHAVAFPSYWEVTRARTPEELLTAADYATLMRVICERNGGTFITVPPRGAP